MRKTRIGFIGAGIIANRHAGNLLGCDDVDVVAVADLLLDRVRALAARCDAQVYGDYRQMLDAERLDAFYICIPPFAHSGPELTTIERRLPFFVEKPLAADLATADTVATAWPPRG